jgi:hypothetical protein
VDGSGDHNVKKNKLDWERQKKRKARKRKAREGKRRKGKERRKSTECAFENIFQKTQIL